LTLLKQDKDQVTVNRYTVGKHDQAIRKEIGVVIQDSLLDLLLTVKEKRMQHCCERHNSSAGGYSSEGAYAIFNRKK